MTSGTAKRHVLVKMYNYGYVLHYLYQGYMDICVNSAIVCADIILYVIVMSSSQIYRD